MPGPIRASPTVPESPLAPTPLPPEMSGTSRAPLVRVMRLQVSPVMSMTPGAVIDASASRRLPGPESLQFSTVTSGGIVPRVAPR